ncbi:YugN-like family protein [Priestia flexa]|uniref:YugN-like family protein n=1 Tax=Priestia TaxID=2800373 RepID=UPI000955A409|nr:YugN-like family protein [Priestia flexa]MBY6086849.1 YugN-like family protein [Priestia flexa]MCA1203658.1 YugN-like family protein [Priestia flexa]MCG7314966.1 YugN-like family protein [Priestia flexa]WHX78787.1 YugN-like family protein [Priestia flexa]SIQ08166.1 YugN-like family protein [Priestia flexa]
MIELASKLEGELFKLYVLEQTLKPLGYVIGGNWDYDHGFFDYKINDEVGYQFLRIPFQAMDGQLDSQGTTVQIGKPYLLSHKYQIGLDDNVHVGNINASFNQFAEPQDPDAQFPDEYLSLGKELLKEAEEALQS